jgi:hypothetical protein
MTQQLQCLVLHALVQLEEPVENGLPAIPHPRLRSLITPDGAIILDPKQNLVISVDAIGAYVWGRLQDGQAVHTIIKDLAHETGTEVVTVERDVYEFVEALNGKHLFVPAHR